MSCDPGNLGTIYRSAYGFNFSGVVNIGGCHSLSSKVIRSSMASVVAPDMLNVEIMAGSTEDSSADAFSTLLSTMLSPQHQDQLFILVSVAPSSTTVTSKLGIGNYSGAGNSYHDPIPYCDIDQLLHPVENKSLLDFQRNDCGTTSLPSNRVMLVLGSEAFGVTPRLIEWLSCINDPRIRVVYITIPMEPRAIPMESQGKRAVKNRLFQIYQY